MRSNGCIDPAAGAVLAQHQIMQHLAHAVQALELKAFPVIACHFQDRRDGMGVVCGKLRIDALAHVQKFARAADIGHICCRLAGENRKACQSFDLRALNLGIPIGALYKTHHDLAIKLGRKFMQPIQNSGGAFAVGLDHNAKSIPSRQ